MNSRPSMAFGVPSTPLITPITAMMTISMSVKATKNLPRPRFIK
jgi:hypothetical protein